MFADGEAALDFARAGTVGQAWIVTDLSRFRGLAGSALFTRLDAAGKELGSFGRSSRKMAEKDQWVLGEGYSTDYWAASMWEYKLYRGTSQAVELAVVREADWFPQGEEWSPEILATEAPPPLITHLYEDPDGLLWVFITLADADWSADIPKPGSAEWIRHSFDTVIEVIDVREHRVLAEYRSDDWLAPICGTRLVYSITLTPEGDTRVAVLQPRLER